MISRYLKNKSIIDQIKPILDEKELNMDNSPTGYYLELDEYNGNYYQFSDVFSHYELDKIIMMCKKLPIIDGTIGDNEVDESYRKSSISWVPVNNETLWMYQKLTDCVKEANIAHFQYDLTKIEKLQFTSYIGNKNEFYSPHLDISTGFLVENRKLTFVLQLSDPNDYGGGILKLHTGKEPHSIKKEKGLITFFPSHTLHECTPVTSGHRFTLVGWVHGPKLR